jgi:hypothetical protein
LNVVASNGTYCVCKIVKLYPGVNVITLQGISGKIEVCLYSPVTSGEVGDAIIPISHHGFLIQKTTNEQGLCFIKVDKIEYNTQPEFILLPLILLVAIIAVFVEKGLRVI